MSKKYLNYHEKKSIGKYDYLDFDQTQKNLKEYQNKIIFNKGYINKDFKKFSNPKKVNWLSIDLNSSQPTLDCLNFFYKLMEKNGIIIFDDYGSPNYVDTKKVVDKFFKKKKNRYFNYLRARLLLSRFNKLSIVSFNRCDPSVQPNTNCNVSLYSFISSKNCSAVS